MNSAPSVAFSAPDPNNPEAFLSGLMGFIQPALIALQVGSMAGHLGRLSFGSYDLPLPRPSGDRLNLVPANIAGFAKEWSLGLDAVQMRLLLGELAHHAVLRVPHVADKLQSLLHRYADGYAIDATSLEGRLDSLLGGFDPTDPGAMGEAFSDPTKLWESAVTPAQREAARDITTVVTVIEGWVDHVVARASARLLGGDRRLDEALRRRRLSGSSGDRMAERLLGISVDQAAFDRGSAFVKGVIERAGDDALHRLWNSAETLPTKNEIEAPGLWLARLDLD
jgi:putative hydrolase